MSVTICETRIRLRLAPCIERASMAVLENEDLLHLILQHARLTPAAFVAASRVSKGWRHVCQRDHMLLLSTV
eukprot:3539891-Prymnesium_polylepis.1